MYNLHVALNKISGFQRRVIYLLTELRDLLRNPRNNLACHQGLESNTPIIEMEQHDTLESFEEFNQRLNEKKELDLCVSILKVLKLNKQKNINYGIQ